MKTKNPAAVALGAIRSPRKAQTSAANGAKGGRPHRASIVAKADHETGDEHYLTETHGYGAAWSRDRTDAKMFTSAAAAKRAIKAMQLHRARVLSAE